MAAAILTGFDFPILGRGRWPRQRKTPVMSDRDLSPLSDSSRPQSAGHQRIDDDIELPPSTESDSVGGETEAWSTGHDGPRNPNRFPPFVGAAALIAAIAIGGWFLSPNSSTENQHPNWQHVAAATDASSADANQLVLLDASGDTQTLPTVEVSSADLDRSATRNVRAALRRDNLILATAELQAAQSLASSSQNPEVRPPELVANSDVVAALKEGRQELFEIELFDCCDEDGDVVEVIVNGSPFATVPILHGGTKVAVPLAQGNNKIAIRGVKDGGGGVTLSFRTSRGDYYARLMRVGEQYEMGVIVR